MTREEFKTRTGMELTNEQFQRVNDMYMEAGELSKDAFCEDYKKHSESKILEEFYNQATRFNVRLNAYAMFLIEQADKWGAEDLRDKAIEILGIDKYLTVKIEKGYNLWDIDKKELIEILKNR